ncbi:hypothetical protein GW17_00033293 [Ensete ventricosum]|nr:hypothetical protein GW17_00033293 [Ensete ventricosum]
MEFNQDLGFERYCRLSNTTHSEIAPSLSLPSLPVCFGSFDQLGLSDVPGGSRSGDRPDILAHAGTIAELLRNCDMWKVVMFYEQRRSNQTIEKKPFGQGASQVQRDNGGECDDRSEKNLITEPPSFASSRKPKIKKKESDSVPSSVGPDILDHQGIVGSFCEMAEDFCGRAEMPDDAEGAEVSSIPLTDIRTLLNQIMSIRCITIIATLISTRLKRDAVTCSRDRFWILQELVDANDDASVGTKEACSVSAIVEADPEVLCDKRVQCAVEGRFCDSAISVREAALELVGRHIASHPEVGLKDLVCKTFFELWFEEPTGSQKHLIADGSSVPMEVAKKTEQIVDMLRNMPNSHHLVTVIKRNLTLDFLPQSAKATGINAASLASVRKRCELICKRLLERILQVEEETSDKEEVCALPYPVKDLRKVLHTSPYRCTRTISVPL